MQINSNQIKLHTLFFYITIICCAHINAQLVPVEDYLQQAGCHAEIYNGKVEEVYNSLIYKELPYYKNADFTESSIIYKGNYYPLQKARLDLFREQLVILSPEIQLFIIHPKTPNHYPQISALIPFRACLRLILIEEWLLPARKGLFPF